MKKILVGIMLSLVLIMSVACAKTPVEQAGSVTVAIGGDTVLEYTVDLGEVEISQGVFSVLKYLNENENLELEWTGDGNSVFLTKVGNICEDKSKGEYIYVYTTVEKDFDVLYGIKTTHKDVELTSSGVGVAEMTVQDGAIYYFGIIKW